MPVKSILPPVIEKAHSSGSTKRKADEAGVGGDKTPPKELKATFAPEPKGRPVSYISNFTLFIFIVISKSGIFFVLSSCSFIFPSQ
jgi:hypothetical protein